MSKGMHMSEKSRIVAALGERRLLLPFLLNEALGANDRAKFRLTLLQMAMAHGDAPEEAFSDLRTERLACGIADPSYDDVVAGTVRRGDSYAIPTAGELCAALRDDVAAMIAPFEAAQKPEADGYHRRLRELSATAWIGEDGTIAGGTIAALGSGDPARGDSLHLLIMEMHKALNGLQSEIA